MFRSNNARAEHLSRRDRNVSRVRWGERLWRFSTPSVPVETRRFRGPRGRGRQISRNRDPFLLHSAAAQPRPVRIVRDIINYFSPSRTRCIGPFGRYRVPGLIFSSSRTVPPGRLLYRTRLLDRSVMKQRQRANAGLLRDTCCTC